MADTQLKLKIYQILREGYFSDVNDFVDVSDGEADTIHIIVVSRKFDGLRFREKLDLITAELMAKLPQEEWSQVSLSVGASPEEIKAL